VRAVLPRRLLLALFLTLSACAMAPSAPAEESGSAEPDFVMTGGVVRLDRDKGLLVLRLPVSSCSRAHVFKRANGDIHTVDEPCPAFPRTGWQAARLVTPWGAKLTPSQGGAGGVAFRIDWAKTGIDALAPDAATHLQRPWRIESPDAYEPAEWEPVQADLDAMVALIGRATDTQIEVADVSAPPQVEVVSLRTVDELRNGTSGQLVVEVHNKGVGAAYRLVATTRSNIPALSGLQISFGRLLPGETKTRRMPVALPRLNREDEALVVLLFREAHRFAPAQASARFPVRPAVDVAQLGIACKLLDLAPGPGDPRPLVDAGQTTNLSCEVRNDGAPVAEVRVVATLEGRTTRVTSAPFDLPTGHAHQVLLAIDVPQDAAIDSELGLVVETVGGKDAAVARTRLSALIARPQICPEGKLTREDFARKRDELRRKLAAGLITKAEYQKYEAELVACLE
jgi:hypothetical protein